MKTATKSTKQSAASAAGTPQQPPLSQQPALKSQAACEAGLFLSTNDKWSLAYFDANDLHCEERELFG
ncbi:MAG TPA: hypothetical protein VMV72_16705 [Verrucomicrobiae bacterium]|nr:hypothetical protein [Verrucomicrobiae bacterium]